MLEIILWALLAFFSAFGIVEFVKFAEKHIVETPIKIGEHCGVYYEEELEEVKWEISMRVIPEVENAIQSDN